MSKTLIDWTDEVWNPLRGCTPVSEGCRNCYAARIAARPNMSGPGGAYEGLAEMKNGKSRWTGKIQVVEHLIEAPLKWKKPRFVFVNSMSDLFHEKVPAETIFQIFDVMGQCPQHVFQILTKRPEIAAALDMEGMLAWQPNIWMGVSVENIATVHRLETLRPLQAHVKFVSCEPLLEDISPNSTVRSAINNWLDWVIVGGETGTEARIMEGNWARNLRDDCALAETPFFFKQWGGRRRTRTLDGREYNERPPLAPEPEPVPELEDWQQISLWE